MEWETLLSTTKSPNKKKTKKETKLLQLNGNHIDFLHLQLSFFLFSANFAFHIVTYVLLPFKWKKIPALGKFSSFVDHMPSCSEMKSVGLSAGIWAHVNSLTAKII